MKLLTKKEKKSINKKKLGFGAAGLAAIVTGILIGLGSGNPGEKPVIPVYVKQYQTEVRRNWVHYPNRGLWELLTEEYGEDMVQQAYSFLRGKQFTHRLYKNELGMLIETTIIHGTERVSTALDILKDNPATEKPGEYRAMVIKGVLEVGLSNTEEMIKVLNDNLVPPGHRGKLIDMGLQTGFDEVMSSYTQMESYPFELEPWLAKAALLVGKENMDEFYQEFEGLGYHRGFLVLASAITNVEAARQAYEEAYNSEYKNDEVTERLVFLDRLHEYAPDADHAEFEFLSRWVLSPYEIQQ